MKRKIKLFDPSIGEEESKSLEHVLKSKMWASGTGQGKVLEFEKKFKKYVKSKSCIAVNIGTAALNLALSIYDIKNKDINLSLLSELLSIPTFAEIESEMENIDPLKIYKNIDELNHLFGTKLKEELYFLKIQFFPLTEVKFIFLFY